MQRIVGSVVFFDDYVAKIALAAPSPSSTVRLFLSRSLFMNVFLLGEACPTGYF